MILSISCKQRGVSQANLTSNPAIRPETDPEAEAGRLGVEDPFLTRAEQTRREPDKVLRSEAAAPRRILSCYGWDGFIQAKERKDQTIFHMVVAFIFLPSTSQKDNKVSRSLLMQPPP
ncbi:hypothetical protein CDL15_Pgr026896 [Punica granatum]|uniref:Uncharacterized protein n=1 Tax=Punica granatum TaxID=22663 RepID=A0A218WP70_PUNGR|nr:hypothetical protein CDL15_Pgr026896 [Punica granatum]